MDAKNDDSPVLDYDGDGELDVEDEACYTAVATPIPIRHHYKANSIAINRSSIYGSLHSRHSASNSADDATAPSISVSTSSPRSSIEASLPSSDREAHTTPAAAQDHQLSKKETQIEERRRARCLTDTYPAQEHEQLDAPEHEQRPAPQYEQDEIHTTSQKFPESTLPLPSTPQRPRSSSRSSRFREEDPCSRTPTPTTTLNMTPPPTSTTSIRPSPSLNLDLPIPRHTTPIRLLPWETSHVPPCPYITLPVMASDLTDNSALASTQGQPLQSRQTLKDEKALEDIDAAPYPSIRTSRSRPTSPPSPTRSYLSRASSTTTATSLSRSSTSNLLTRTLSKLIHSTTSTSPPHPSSNTRPVGKQKQGKYVMIRVPREEYFKYWARDPVTGVYMGSEAEGEGLGRLRRGLQKSEGNRVSLIDSRKG